MNVGDAPGYEYTSSVRLAAGARRPRSWRSSCGKLAPCARQRRPPSPTCRTSRCAAAATRPAPRAAARQRIAGRRRPARRRRARPASARCPPCRRQRRQLRQVAVAADVLADGRRVRATVATRQLSGGTLTLHPLAAAPVAATIGTACSERGDGRARRGGRRRPRNRRQRPGGAGRCARAAAQSPSCRGGRPPCPSTTRSGARAERSRRTPRPPTRPPSTATSASAAAPLLAPSRAAAAARRAVERRLLRRLEHRRRGVRTRQIIEQEVKAAASTCGTEGDAAQRGPVDPVVEVGHRVSELDVRQHHVQGTIPRARGDDVEPPAGGVSSVRRPRPA